MGNSNGSYKLTGFIVLVVGVLFFLRDLGVNYIGDTSGWTIVLVLIGAGILSGGSVVAAKAIKKR